MKHGDEHNTCLIQFCEFKIRNDQLCRVHWKEHLGHDFAVTKISRTDIMYCPSCGMRTSREYDSKDICPVKSEKFKIYVAQRRQYLLEEYYAQRLVNTLLDYIPACPDCKFHCVEWTHNFIVNAVRSMLEPIGVLTILMALVRKQQLKNKKGIVIEKQEVFDAAHHSKDFGIKYETDELNAGAIRISLQEIEVAFKHTVQPPTPDVDDDGWPTFVGG